LSQQSGFYPSKLLGNAGFAKLDVGLSARNQLALRLSTSRYSGANNVFLDPSSPMTTYGISDNGTEHVTTETATASLTLSWWVVSHLRLQYSRELQWSEINSNSPLTRIPGIIDGFGRSTILPRETREHRQHVAETISRESSRHSWKFGGDALLTHIYNYFPSTFGGEYIFDPIKVDPFTFQPMIGGLELTPLRAYAHQVPHYYFQRVGTAASHPDSNDYSAFAQDTIRVTGHLGVSLGIRYDLQTFGTKYLKTNPLWPESPARPEQLCPEGWFLVRDWRPDTYGRPSRIRIVLSTHSSDLQLGRRTGQWAHAKLNFSQSNQLYAQQIFPQYPFSLVDCAPLARSCTAPANLLPFVSSDVSAFAHDFRTPEVHQASRRLSGEIAHRVIADVSYSFVHGQDLIRARDLNLSQPTSVQYPILDSSGVNVLGYGTIESFSTWQLTQSLTCPFPPCVNRLTRPIPQLGSIDVFESTASSVYHGGTVSLRRQMTHGLYFRLGYTYAHAIDDGQDPLVAGLLPRFRIPMRPAQNAVTALPISGTGSSSHGSTNYALNGGRGWLGKVSKNWKNSGVITAGSGRPVNPRVIGDANQDDNSSNDRLPAARRNSFVGPNYTTTDMRISRRIYVRKGLKLDFTAESFNLFNRLNRRFQLTDDGIMSNGAQFNYGTKHIGINYFPAYYRVPANFMKATGAYAPRQIQFAVRMSF
jgi:TonB dependent receptor